MAARTNKGNKAVSQLEAVTTIANSDLLLVTSNGESKKLHFGNLMNTISQITGFATKSYVDTAVETSITNALDRAY